MALFFSIILSMTLMNLTPAVTLSCRKFLFPFFLNEAGKSESDFKPNTANTSRDGLQLCSILECDLVSQNVKLLFSIGEQMAPGHINLRPAALKPGGGQALQSP